MPWQRQVSDVVGEVLPSGDWAYPTVVIEVQRQAGKTTIVDATGVHRGLTGPDRGIWYTAQTRQDARDQWMQLVKRIRRSPLKPPHSKIRESNGSESITFPTGSELRPFAPVEDALHGKPVDLVTIDEAWSHSVPQGDALVQAILPGFNTHPGQMWIVSAAGTHESQWLRGMIDTGRMMVDAGRRDTLAFFSFGIGDDVDPADLAAVALAHPAYGFTLRPQALITAATMMKPGEFARAFGSRWTGKSDRAIPALLWTTGADAVTPIPAGPGAWALGLDVGLDGLDAALAIAWRDHAGIAHVELVDAREGTGWLTDRQLQLVREHDPRALGIDAYGPAVAAAEAGRRAGLEYLSTATDQWATACAGFLAELVNGTLKYRPHPALDQAAESAAKRPVGDRWVWGRRASASTIAPLCAATIALWAFDHAPPHEPFAIR